MVRVYICAGTDTAVWEGSHDGSLALPIGCWDRRELFDWRIPRAIVIFIDLASCAEVFFL